MGSTHPVGTVRKAGEEALPAGTEKRATAVKDVVAGRAAHPDLKVRESYEKSDLMEIARKRYTEFLEKLPRNIEPNEAQILSIFRDSLSLSPNSLDEIHKAIALDLFKTIRASLPKDVGLEPERERVAREQAREQLDKDRAMKNPKSPEQEKADQKKQDEVIRKRVERDPQKPHEVKDRSVEERVV